MDEANAQLAERDSEADMPTAMSEDKLLTTRLPPMTPPPMRPPSVPPAAEASTSYPSTSGGSYAPSGASYGPVSGTYRGDTSVPPAPRTSWWKALLTATSPPPSNVIQAPTDDRVVRRRIGATCAGMAIGFVILALALGLRGSEPAFSPVVAAAMVVARSIIAVGFLAFGYGLLRMAERFFTSRPDAPPSSANLH
jgi:hypothetical protein